MISVFFVGVAMVLAAQTTAHETPHLWVDVAAELRCPDEEAVLTALRTRLGEKRVTRGRAAARGLDVRLSARGARGVNLVLRRSGRVVVERAIDVGTDECTALAETLALMVESWLSPAAEGVRGLPERLPVVSPPAAGNQEVSPFVAAAPPTSEGPSERVPPNEGRPSASGAPAEGAGPETSTAPPLSTPAAAPIRFEPAPLPPSLPAPSATASLSAPVVSPGHAWAIMLAANAGAMVSLDARTVVTANGGADLGVEHRGWRMGVRGAFESSADLDVSAAEVMVRHVPIAAYLGRRLAGGQPVVVTGAAGAGVDLVSARTSGYATPRSFSATDAIVLAELQGEWRVRRQLGVICAADLILALRRERYAIANLGPVANTSRLRAGLALGVAWHLQ